MKAIITLLLLTIMQIASSQDLFYYYNGEKIPLKLSTEKIYVKFKEGKTDDEKRQIISSIPSLKPLERGKSEKLKDASIIVVGTHRNKATVKAAISKLNLHKDIIVANPFVIYPFDSTLQGITEQFVVKLNSPADFIELERIAEETKTIIYKQNDFEPSIYHLIADKNSKGNALEMANYFHESGKFVFADPNFLKILKRHCSDDQYFGDQWALHNTGQQNGTPGADIKACQAWHITRGRHEIRTAIIDEGVDLNHPDLVNNLAPGFDATGNGSNGAPQGNEAHSATCAEIIAVQGKNEEGIL